MQAVWDLEQGKYGFGMFTYSIFFSLSLSFLTFLLVLCGGGDDLGFFKKKSDANVYGMPRTVF